MMRKFMSEKRPMVLVLAGPDGSGKSTITQYLEKAKEVARVALGGIFVAFLK